MLARTGVVAKRASIVDAARERIKNARESERKEEDCANDGKVPTAGVYSRTSPR